MSWPTLTEYQQAIQNPHLCFSDVTIKAGSPEIGLWNAPKAMSGAFAVVFQINSGSEHFAVKCFTKYHPDQEQRYARISTYLQQTKLPYFVGFEFLSQGIKVKNNWYPIVKMQWLEGDPFDGYLKKNLRNPQAIKTLAEQFFALISDLKRWGIAHGDLQHGNILILNGQIRLIDYDGMYVPGLDGMSSHELGHRNYQHPLRNEKHFGPYLDNFSALVIYSSMVALFIDPSLWDRVRAGDDCLLFRREDFEYPNGSEALYVLDQMGNDAARSLASLFRSVPQSDLTKVPLLDNVKISFAQISPVTAVPPPLPPDVTVPGSSWVWDHIKERPVYLHNSFTVQRFFVVTFILAGGFLGYAAITGLLASTIAIFIIIAEVIFLPLILFSHYQSLQQVTDKQTLHIEIKNLQTEIKNSETKVKDLETAYRKFDQDEAQTISAIRAKQREYAQLEKTELDKVERELLPIMTDINWRRQSLIKAESAEAGQALLNAQTQALHSKLSKYSLSNASIEGLGAEMKRRLTSAGVRTAADVLNISLSQSGYGRNSNDVAHIEISGKGYVHVEGIGPKKAKTLLSWRKGLESKFRNQIPAALTASQEAAIKSKYQNQRRGLDVQESKAKDSARQKKDDIRKKFRQQQDALTKELQNYRNQMVKQRRDAQQKINDEKRLLSPKEWKLGGLKRKLEAFRNVTFSEYFKRSFFLGSAA